jgi:hypothetical protein
MDQSEVHMIALRDLPQRFFTALVHAKASPARLALAAEDKGCLSILAAYVAMLARQSLASNDFDSWRPNQEYLLPKVTARTPLRLVHGLLRAGVTMVMFERILRDQSALESIAKVVDMFAPRPLTLDFSYAPADAPQVIGTSIARYTSKDSHVRGIPCKVKCFTYESGKRFLACLNQSGKVSDEAAKELLDAQVMWLHRVQLVFRVIPSAYFVSPQDERASAPLHRALKAITETYSRSKIERVPASLALAFVRELEKQETLAKLHGKIEWVQVLHAPFNDIMGNPSVMKCLLGPDRTLSKLVVEDAPASNTQFDDKGAFAVLATECMV